MQKSSTKYFHKELLGLVLGEFFVIAVSVYVAAGIRFSDNFKYLVTQFDNFLIPSGVFAVVMVFSMSVLGMYQSHFKADMRTTLLWLMPSFVLGFGIITFVFYLIPAIYFGRGVLGIVMIVAPIGLLLTRYLFFKSNVLNIFKSRLLILGCGTLAKECYELAKSIKHHDYEVVGFVPMQDETCCITFPGILLAEESLLGTIKKHNADEIIVAVQNRRNSNLSSTGKFRSFTGASTQKPIEELLQCKLAGVGVIDAATFFEREASQIRVDSLQPSWLVFGGGFDQSFLRAFSKRVFDWVASLILLIITMPVTLVTALCIFIEDRAPIFYQQERVGKNGQTFMVLKFRSMRNNAEVSGQPQWATENDPRATKVGRIIRKLRIDEIPQIINVFKGDMSFVGPRPERPFFVDQLNASIPYYNVRHSIKPGITGLAQVSYHYGASAEDAIRKLQYDLYYVKNNSLFLDILILIDTFQVVLLGKGAR